MPDPSVVRARFAPSPTGYLHVGGARTALFNWLFCRKHGGRFILRIEDTDVQRNIEGAEQKLLDDLRWLAIDWDEGPDVGGAHGPYRQSERRDLYRAAVERLLASGQAYHAFDTPDELDALRKQAVAEKRSFEYPRPQVLPTAADVEKARAEGRPVVIRFKAPNEALTVHDEILGEVNFPEGQVDDFVIVKSNGWPTYHLAVVVDDAGMEITHVLRAQEHLMNTPKHVLLQRALGAATPKFAHLPLVFNMDGSKMSKRDKHKVVRQAANDRIKQEAWSTDDVARLAETNVETAKKWLAGADTEMGMAQVKRMARTAGVVIPEIDVHDFRAAGYLPEALVNFIALIGWSPGGDREKLTREEMIEAFGLDRINKTAGRFDRDKLLSFSTDYFAEASLDRAAAAFDDYLALNDTPVAAATPEQRRRLIEIKQGFRTLREVDEKSRFFFTADDAIEIDPKAARKVLDKGEPTGRAMLAAMLPILEGVEDWTAAALEGVLKTEAENRAGGKLGKIAQPIRVALTGTTVSPAIFDTLAILGRQRTLNRIRRCLGLAQ